MTPEDPARTGPVALFVHGIATNAYLWRNVIGALAGSIPATDATSPSTCRCTASSPVTAGQDLSVAALAAGPGGLLRRARAHRHRSRRQRHRRGHRADLRRPPPAAAGLAHPDRLRHRPATCRPRSSSRRSSWPRAGDLAPTAVALFADLDAAAKVAFGTGYEHLDRVDPAVIRLLPGTVLRDDGARPGVRKAAGRPGRRRPGGGHASAQGAHRAHAAGVGHRGRASSTSPGPTGCGTPSPARPRWSPSTARGCSSRTSAPWTWCRTWSSTGRRLPRCGRDRQPVRPYVLLPRPVGGAGGPLTTAACR